ncbi:MAG TPA: hypothetical protein VHV78_17565, partial [Gemmatimonadaceae bacterium]|nr:hypothetical protein [Gemmatimonadaceae bacterium]
MGDGTLSHGDYNSLAEAFAALPDTTTRGPIVVCIEEGVHRVTRPIVVTQDRVVIRGCGPNTRIEAPRGAFTLEGRRQITFTDLMIESPDAPGISAHDVRELTIRDSRIRMSQLVQTSKPVTIERAGNAAAAGSATAAPRASSGKPIIEPGLTFHFRRPPALLLQGWEMNVIRTEVRGSTTGGGIAILPGSGDVTICDNNIHKSVLPGIDFSYAAAASDGRLEMRLNSVGAAFESITIRDNTITDIAAPAIFHDVVVTPVKTTGQDVAGAVGAATMPALISDLTIEGNLVARCGPGDGTRQFLPTAPLEGAIMLAYVERLSMVGNRIIENGRRYPSYVGVVVEWSEGVVLKENLISLNGRLLQEGAARPGAGGAIFQFALPESAELVGSATQGWPAIVAEENTIDAVNGPALLVNGTGTMRIRGNMLSNRNAKPTLRSACLLVMNIGSTEETDSSFEQAFGNYVNAGSPGEGKRSPLTDAGGMTMVADNQIVTVSAESSAGYGSVVLSRDDVSFSNNQVRVKTDEGMLINVMVTAPTLRVVGNRFSEPLDGAVVSCIGIGDMVVGAANQATHCLIFDGLYATVP